MMTEPDPAAWVSAARERNEHYIRDMRYTEWTVSRMPSGDLRKALGALEAVLDLCAEHEYIPGQFSEDTEEEIPPREIRRVIARKLLGEEETDGD
jgi:hypothetical protein